MRTELSSPRSWIYRWGVPAALTVGAVLALVGFAGVLDDQPPGLTRVIAGVVIAVLLMAVARVFDRAKRVWLDGDELVIGYYGRETRLPLADVERVDTQPWVWPHRVRLTFSRPTPFGPHAVFFPPLSFKRNHPVIKKFRARLSN